VEVLAPAKINLNLRVLGKREDGFHEIDTLIAPLTLSDTLNFERSNEHRFTCTDTSLPTDDNNLVVRAVREFERDTGSSCAVHIHLRKCIPHGAGLGGGSSDAASTLLALDSLFQTELGLDRLTVIAARLGSDVPAFLHGAPVRCKGRGEIVEPAPGTPSYPVLLIKPAFAVPTPWAYKNWADSQEHCGVDYAPQHLGDLNLFNDLERPVFEKYLLLPVIKVWLQKQPEVRAALMSGSGSTMLAILASGDDASPLLTRFNSEVSEEFWTWSGHTIASRE
jgi:4-diphosphocytidyl-2-C-methyl-D-erythritol kinase